MAIFLNSCLTLMQTSIFIYSDGRMQTEGDIVEFRVQHTTPLYYLIENTHKWSTVNS